jgi:hypothetical protein
MIVDILLGWIAIGVTIIAWESGERHINKVINWIDRRAIHASWERKQNAK